MDSGEVCLVPARTSPSSHVARHVCQYTVRGELRDVFVIGVRHFSGCDTWLTAPSRHEAASRAGHHFPETGSTVCRRCSIWSDRPKQSVRKPHSKRTDEHVAQTDAPVAQLPNRVLRDVSGRVGVIFG